MKMKRRLFQSKHKKKKSTSTTEPVINDSVSAADSVIPSTDENHGKISGTKKKLKFRKHKSKSHKVTDRETSDQTATTPPTKVVLRRTTNSHFYVDPSRGNKTALEKRIPDSLSSSRTPSSASSASFNRWSSRRPRSLIEALPPQSLSEFEEPNIDSSSNEVTIRVPVRPVSSIITVQREASIEELGVDPRSDDQGKGFSLDLPFFRRFKLSSYSPKSDENASSPPLLSAERLSLRLKNFKSSKNSKNNRRSWHEPSHSYSVHTDSPPFMTPTLTGNKSYAAARRSVTDPSGFLGIKENVEEEEQIQPFHAEVERNISVCSSNYSTASTVFLTSHSASKRSSFRDSLAKQDSVCSVGSSICSETKELCEKCHGQRESVRRSACSCYFVCPFASPYESDQGTLQRTVSSFPGSRDDLDDSDFYPRSPLYFAKPAEPYDKWKKNSKHMSLLNLASISADKSDEDHESTLTRQNVHAKNAGFRRLEELKGSAVYASSPQLSKESVGVNHKWKKTKPTADSPSSCGSVLSARSRDSAVVDSPIKRAIGYPSVVLRRPWRLKHANEAGLSKTASEDHLSRKERAKLVTSLNMEDLPTYTMMRDVSLNEKDNRSSEGRELSINAILYQRHCLSYATSVDDIRKAHMLGSGDFQRFCEAETQSNSSSGREGYRPGQIQVIVQSCIFFAD